MKKLLVLLTSLVFSSSVWAHSGEDPLRDLEKNNHRLAAKQENFSSLKTREERLDNLEAQSSYLRKNILILKNLMVKDYPHIKANMSKYKLDYMDELDENLSSLRMTLKQMKKTLP